MNTNLESLKLEYHVAKVCYDALMKKRAKYGEEAQLCDANAVSRLESVAIESHKAKLTMLEKEQQYLIAEAESMREQAPESDAVLRCSAEREAYFVARDERSTVMRNLLLAWEEADVASYEEMEKIFREVSRTLKAVSKEYAMTWKAAKKGDIHGNRV